MIGCDCECTPLLDVELDQLKAIAAMIDALPNNSARQSAMAVLLDVACWRCGEPGNASQCPCNPGFDI